MVKTYVSYGGGVNSTAMIIHLLKTKQHIDEIVFADTGAEWPQTYEYMAYFETHYLAKYGYRISWITAQELGIRKETLLANHQRLSTIPHRLHRTCTSDWKIKPLHRYCQNPCVYYLGIDAGEAHRAKPSRNDEIINEFPLIEAGIDRRECARIIRDEGLCLPRKSGCFFCPFGRIGQYRELYQLYPDLFNIVLDLEKAHDKKFNTGKEIKFYLKDKPMWELAERFASELEAEEMQLELFDDPQDSMNCLCKFA